jgi:hypothetical protein
MVKCRRCNTVDNTRCQRILSTMFIDMVVHDHRTVVIVLYGTDPIISWLDAAVNSLHRAMSGEIQLRTGDRKPMISWYLSTAPRLGNAATPAVQVGHHLGFYFEALCNRCQRYSSLDCLSPKVCKQLCSKQRELRLSPWPPHQGNSCGSMERSSTVCVSTTRQECAARSPSRLHV